MKPGEDSIAPILKTSGRSPMPSLRSDPIARGVDTPFDRLTRRWRLQALAVSTTLHCAALLLLTAPLWIDAVGELGRRLAGAELRAPGLSEELAPSDRLVEESSAQDEDRARGPTRLRVIFSAPRPEAIASTPPVAPLSSESMVAAAAPQALEAAWGPEPLDGALAPEPLDGASAPVPLENALVPEPRGGGLTPEPVDLASVHESSGEVAASASVGGVPVPESLGGASPQDLSKVRDTSDPVATAASPDPDRAAGAASAPVAVNTAPIAASHAALQVERVVEASQARVAAEVPEPARTAAPIPIETAPGLASRPPAERLASSPAKPQALEPGLTSPALALATPSLEPAPTPRSGAEPRSTKAERQRRMAEELHELSERIKAYQAREEKARLEAEQLQRWPQGGEGEGSVPLPRKSPLPESASPESITKARLAVALTSFQSSHRYRMYYGDRKDDSVVALVKLDVEVDGELYRMRSEARPQGLAAVLFQGIFTQESRGRVSPWGYRPEQYEEQRGNRGTRWAQMDWAAGEVRLPDGERQPIAPGVQDRLSIAWQLSALARHQLARLQSPEGIQIPLLLSRHVELNRFFGREVADVELEGQRLRLLKVEREPRKGKRDARIEVWLDTERDMLPVRVRIADDRDRVIDQVIVLGAS